MAEPGARRSWLRANRIWLVALPLALVVLLVGSAYHVRTFWYDSGLHHQEASARAGHVVRVVDRYTDVVGATSRTFDVRLDGVSDVRTYPDDSLAGSADPPAGTRAVAVHLDFRAAPGQVLSGCSMALEDSEGRRYQVPDPAVQAYRCVPEDHPGPDLALLRGAERGVVAKGAARPVAWSTAPVFLVAKDARITKVLVWWTMPRYVALEVAR